MSLKELYNSFIFKSKDNKIIYSNLQNSNKLQPSNPWPNPPNPKSGITSNFIALTGSIILSSSNSTGGASISGFSSSGMIIRDAFDDFLDQDKRPDFEKAYDVFIKNKEDDKKLTEKELFEQAMKIGWSIGRLSGK